MADDALSLPGRGMARELPGHLASANAEADLAIGTYFSALRRELRHEPDLEDVMDEISDHLASAVARQEAGGASHAIAVHRALTSFGATKSLGEGFRDRPEAGGGLPTEQTRVAGQILRASAFAIPILVGLFFWSDATETRTGRWQGTAEQLFGAGAIVTVLGNMAAMWGAHGILQRHGRSRSWSALAAMLILVVGTFVSIAAWARALWIPILGLGWIAVIGSVGTRPVFGALTGRMLQLGYVIGFAGIMLTAITRGDDGWQLAGAVPGLVLMTVGLFRAGTFLANELAVGYAPPAAAA